MIRTPHIFLALALALALALLAAGSPVGAEEAPAAEATDVPNIKLSRLQGRARESRSRQVVGAAVLVQRDDDRSRFYLTSSSGDGAFFVDRLPDGEYTVWLNREGYASVVKKGIELRYPFRAVVEVTMTPGQVDLSAAGSVATAGQGAIDVRGRVNGPQGNGLGEVWVRIVRQDGSVDPITVRTPECGEFHFVGLPRGEWRLEVVGIGYLPLRQRLMLNGDSDLAVQLVRQPSDYVPAPLDLMPPEVPIVPEGFAR